MTQSFSKQFFRTFGSLKFAVVLLTLLAIILGLTTIYESMTSTALAQRYVYQSGWFLALLGLLGLNVFCSMMTRFPWKRYHAGFVVTHIGIIILLLGSIIGLLFGVEGTVTLAENGREVSAIRLNREAVYLGAADGGHEVQLPVEMNGHFPRNLGINSEYFGGLQARVLNVFSNTTTRTVVEEGGDAEGPAVHFVFDRWIEGHESHPINYSGWLAPGDSERNNTFGGSVLFKIERVQSDTTLAERMKPPVEPEAGSRGVVRFQFNDTTFSVPVDEYIGKEFNAPDSDVTVLLKEYFADFRVDSKSGQPISASDAPNNPAILFELNAPSGTANGFVFANFPGMNIIRSEDIPQSAVQARYMFRRNGDAAASNAVASNAVASSGHDVITFLIGPNDEVYYVAESKNADFQAGRAPVGEAFELDWSGRAEVVVDEIIGNPRFSKQVVPTPLEPGSRFSFPAVELEISKDGDTVSRLLRWGAPGVFEVGGEAFSARYGYAEKPLGFSVKLLEFSSPKYAGTDMPAAFESNVRLEDPESGLVMERKIWMNNPLTYRGYKLSQSGYEEGTGGRPDKSIIQVMRDPGYPLKLTGSIFIVIGILTVFYIKPFSSLKMPRGERR
ncbi:MAG: cytochrome c biogenesis protein ResB [Verrucomicrobia bacterium]|nr:cytochrome c biogenesis protein ResB [Verrucomicrobiota bacterium]MCF7708120.1 cytochrome c biogenesis protein ResB [Verrucomicrobiota bacterium]